MLCYGHPSLSFVMMRTKAWSVLFCPYTLPPLASAFPASACLASEDSPFLIIMAYPSEILIAHYYRMACVNKDGLVPFLLSVLAYPVTVQYLHIRISSCYPLFGNCLDTLSRRNFIHTHVMCSSSALIC